MSESSNTITTDTKNSRALLLKYSKKLGSAVAKGSDQLTKTSLTGISKLPIADAVEKSIRLGAEMQKTRLEFEAMLGSADKANRVIDDLMKFSDATPFHPAEIIKAGRALLNANVPAEQLIDRLRNLGNIAAGTGVSIGDIANTYADAAIKGKVDTDVLNKLATSSIPIYSELQKIVGGNTATIRTMGEQGKISFAMLDKAFNSLGGSGGRYNGMTERLAETFEGRLSTLLGKLEMSGTTMGELAIPQLSNDLGSLIQKFDEMKKSGELQTMLQGGADAISMLGKSLTELVMFIMDHHEIIAKIGISVAVIGMINEIASAFNILNDSTQTGIGNITSVGLAATKMAPTLAKMAPLLAKLAAMAAVAFGGWEIGRGLDKMTDMEVETNQKLAKKFGKSMLVPTGALAGIGPLGTIVSSPLAGIGPWKNDLAFQQGNTFIGTKEEELQSHLATRNRINMVPTGVLAAIGPLGTIVSSPLAGIGPWKNDLAFQQGNTFADSYEQELQRRNQRRAEREANKEAGKAAENSGGQTTTLIDDWLGNATQYGKRFEGAKHNFTRLSVPPNTLSATGQTRWNRFDRQRNPDGLNMPLQMMTATAYAGGDVNSGVNLGSLTDVMLRIETLLKRGLPEETK
ncbi:MAG: tape measure protein [Victivallales bacterium]|nr:tape measure protein [Victivallales bacterium]